ncbi:hypothetical protein [Bdellovibrio sp. HCB337]|uniref:hypothetical protein n=1 Tax=Bdellovibrio sp. HCB337 TaxID=3394358 RepID=UPI0039A75787
MAVITLGKIFLKGPALVHAILARCVWGIILLFSTINIFQYFAVTGTHINLSEIQIDFTNGFILYIYCCVAVFGVVAYFIPRLATRGVKAKPELAYSRRLMGLALRLTFVTAMVILGLMLSIKEHNGNIGLPIAVVSMFGLIASFPWRSFSEFSQEELSPIVEAQQKQYPPIPKALKLLGIAFIAVGILCFNLVLIGVATALVSRQTFATKPTAYKVCFVGALALVAYEAWKFWGR